MAKPKDDTELLNKLQSWFESAALDPVWRDWRTNAVKAFQYREGEQWTAAEKAELKKRGQPETVNNQISVTIQRLLGQFVELKTKTFFKPRNRPDTGTADILNDLFLYIKQNNQLEFEEVEVADDGMTGGFGVLEVFVDYDDDNDPEIKIRAEDCFNVFPDPKSRRYDWNEDSTYIHRAKWVDLDEALDLYPDHATRLKGLGNNFGTASLGTAVLADIDSLRKELYVDPERKRIRLVETQYKKRVQVVEHVFADGFRHEGELARKDYRELEATHGPAREVKRTKEVIMLAVHTQGLLLEHGATKRKFYSFVPYFVYRKKSGEPYSVVHLAMSLQDAINKRESKAIHLLTANQARYEQGAINDKNELAIEMAKPDGQIELNKGYFERFVVDKNLELATSQFQMHQEAKADFRRVTGVNPDALGERSEIRSGVGVARKVALTNLILAPVYNNFRRTREILARNVLDLVKLHYTTEKVVTITDNLNASRVVALRDNDINEIKQTQYDVIISEAPDLETIQEEQFQTITQALPAMIQFGPFWMEILLELSNIRNKDEILQKIRASSKPPPNEPKISVAAKMEELTPPERAFFYTKMGAPELAQAVMQQGVPPATVIKEQGKQAAEAMKAQASQASEGAKAQTEAVKMRGEQMKGQVAMQKGRMDMAKGQMDMQKKQVEVQAAREKAVIEVQKARAMPKGSSDGEKRDKT